MTKPRALQIDIPRKHAETVGKLICQRAKRLPLKGTPVDGLPGAGDKLLKASRRNLGLKSIKLWTLTKDEGIGLFYWIAWCHWPEMRREFSDKERTALVSVMRGLISALGENRRLSLEDAEYLISNYDQRETLPSHAVLPDQSQVNRLRKWVGRIHEIFGTELNELTPFIQALIVKNYP